MRTTRSLATTVSVDADDAVAGNHIGHGAALEARHPHLSRSALAIVLMLIVVSSGCVGRGKKPLDIVRDAARRTQVLQRHYVYTDTAGQRAIRVETMVEDDFRYGAKLSVDGVLASEEVVRDDALADRYPDPARFGGVSAEVPGAPPESLAALRAGAWVLDLDGAPASLGWPTPPKENAREDPILESLNMLSFAEAGMEEAMEVIRLNPDAVSYRPDEDPFPVPTKASGVQRYDAVRPDLPKPGDSETANQEVPSERHFRKMSVYIKDGLVLEVRETIDVESRLEELERIYGVKFPANRSKRELAAIAIESVNAVRTGQGLQPIKVRTRAVKFSKLGDEVTIELPQDYVEADLGAIRARGPIP